MSYVSACVPVSEHFLYIVSYVFDVIIIIVVGIVIITIDVVNMIVYGINVII